MQSTLSFNTLYRAIPRALRPVLACGLLLAMAVLTAAPAAAQLSGVSYTLSPTYNVVQWDEDLGLEDTELYGGRLGINFGRYLGLQGYYLTRTDVNSEVARLGLEDGLGETLRNREFDLKNYGADLVLSLSRGPVIPFVKAGGGVLRFEGTGIDPLSQINLKLGGGIRFGISRFQGEVFVEDSAFRIDRTRLGTPVNVTPPVPADPDADDLRHNLSFGAGLTFFLGGHDGRTETELDRAIADRYQGGLRGLSIPIEPYVGRVDFNDDFGLDNQELVGVRAGIDLGRLVGLRGYYWRGINDDFDDTEDIQSYGGEAQFKLSSGRGAVPYVTAGVGQLDFLDDFRDPQGLPRDDKTMLILGGGLGFTVGDRVRLDVSARDYILSGTLDAEDVTSTDELFNNWMFSAGFQFSLGGGGKRPYPATAEPVAPQADMAAEGEVAPEAPSKQDAATAEAAPEAGEPAVAAEAAAPETPAPGTAATEMTVAGDQLPPTRNFQGDRIIAIPVPIEGEIYIRYGRPGGVSIESQNVSGAEPAAMPADSTRGPVGMAAPSSAAPDEEALRAAIRRELEAAGITAPPAAPADDMAKMEERLASRIDGRLDRIESELRGLRTVTRDDGRTVVITDDKSPSGDTQVYIEQEPYSWSPTAVRAYTGLNFDDPTQGLLGAKLDLGPVTRNSNFHFLPELAFGFGDDATTFMATGNLEIHFRDFSEKGSWSPLLGAGLGIINFSADENDHSEGVLNLYYGVTANLGRWTAFAEHQGVDLFDLNRLLIGLRLAL